MLDIIRATAIIVGILSVPSIQAQDTADWQTRAGGKMAFDVASVKPGKGAYVPSNVPLTPWDEHIAVNGRFTADAPLETFIEFAHKFWPNEVQSREFAHLPKWATTDRYTIEARSATANPTKDQIRLMMQSLLADRFQLAAHFESREAPVFELRLVRPDQRGPKLVAHADGPPCDKPGASPGVGLPGFPPDCHSLSAIDMPGMLILMGSRDVPLDALAAALSTLGSSGLGRPVIDKTGLTETFDFTVEWAREGRGPSAADSAAPAAPTGPTPFEALRDQLGLKLEPVKASIPILVIDKVERPSEN